jgi:hypothetical protein
MPRSVGSSVMIAAAMLVVPACHEATPVSPSEPVTASITAVRYERVRAITLETTAPVVVTIWYALAPGDPYDRTSPRLCVLDRVGPTTFACPVPHFEFIPVGREWSASVSDPAVSSLPVARDLYLNGSMIRVETFATGGESGVFRIDARGRVS